MTALLSVVTAFVVPPDAVADGSGPIAEAPDTLRRGVELEELTVKKTREKYSKKNNPAVDFINRLRQTGGLNSPDNHADYSYDRYGRLTIAICPFDSARLAKGSFEFFTDYVTESPISGRPMLPMSVKEKSSTVYFSDHGATRKEIVDAVSRNGIDEVVDQEATERILEDALREIDLYQNDITLLQNRFVSPLSRIGPDFYKYYLSDTVTAPDGSRWIELSFVPRTSTTYGFTGKLYVADGDSTMFVRNIRLSFPRNININYIDRISIEQTYERAPDGTRLKTADDLQAELRIVPGLPGIFARRLSLFSNHSFQAPDSAVRLELDAMQAEALTRPDALEKGARQDYWVRLREQEMAEPEQNLQQMMASLRSIKGYRYLEKTFKIFATGRIPTNADFDKSKFDFGPIFNFISHNRLEGWRFMVGGMTTSALSRRWFLTGYGAYGLRDRRWKEGASVEYSFIDKQGEPTDFPVRSLKAEFKNDVYYPGQKLNAYGMLFQSIGRDTDDLIAYRRNGSLTYTHELLNNLSWSIRADVARTESSPCMEFARADGLALNHYNTWQGSATLRWAPGEKFFDSNYKRFKINKDNWEFTLSATAARIATHWARFRKLTVEGTVSKRFWLSAFGFIDAMVEGGKMFGTAPFPELSAMPVNTSYLIVNGTFTLANPMEFVGDLYGRWDLEYNGMGILFNYIPLIKKLKVREVVGLRGWWSSLEAKNNPASNPALFRFPYDTVTTSMPRPYMELYVGLDNILSVLRVDWVWRANYRSVPGCDRWGIRLALHLSF